MTERKYEILKRKRISLAAATQALACAGITANPSERDLERVNVQDGIIDISNSNGSVIEITLAQAELISHEGVMDGTVLTFAEFTAFAKLMKAIFGRPGDLRENQEIPECPACGRRYGRWPHRAGAPGECVGCGNIF